MTKPASSLALNLRHLCADVGTSASVCRSIGMNQQQFSKYVNGVSRPAAHNLRRLAGYFGVEERDLDLPHEQFIARAQVSSIPKHTRRKDVLSSAFPGDIAALRTFIGNYQVYYASPALPGRIVSATMFLHEKNGVVFTRSLEVLMDEGEKRRQWTRCDGKAAHYGERLFVVDFEAKNGGALSMTTLVPPHRYRQGLIFGMSFFLASHPRRTPHASRVVWKRMRGYVSAKELLQSSGSFPMDAPAIHPAIRRYLSSPQESMSVAPPFGQ